MARMLICLQTGPEGQASGPKQSDPSEEALKGPFITSSRTPNEAQTGKDMLGRDQCLIFTLTIH